MPGKNSIPLQCRPEWQATSVKDSIPEYESTRDPHCKIARSRAFSETIKRYSELEAAEKEGHHEPSSNTGSKEKRERSPGRGTAVVAPKKTSGGGSRIGVPEEWSVGSTADTPGDSDRSDKLKAILADWETIELDILTRWSRMGVPSKTLQRKAEEDARAERERLARELLERKEKRKAAQDEKIRQLRVTLATKSYMRNADQADATAPPKAPKPPPKGRPKPPVARLVKSAPSNDAPSNPAPTTKDVPRPLADCHGHGADATEHTNNGNREQLCRSAPGTSTTSLHAKGDTPKPPSNGSPQKSASPQKSPQNTPREEVTISGSRSPRKELPTNKSNEMKNHHTPSKNDSEIEHPASPPSQPNTLPTPHEPVSGPEITAPNNPPEVSDAPQALADQSPKLVEAVPEASETYESDFEATHKEKLTILSPVRSLGNLVVAPLEQNEYSDEFSSMSGKAPSQPEAYSSDATPDDNLPAQSKRSGLNQSSGQDESYEEAFEEDGT